MKYIVDRIEGEFAVCEAEDQSMVDIPLSELPEGIKESDHLMVTNEGYETAPISQERKERIRNLIDDLWDH